MRRWKQTNEDYDTEKCGDGVLLLTPVKNGVIADGSDFVGTAIIRNPSLLSHFVPHAAIGRKTIIHKYSLIGCRKIGCHYHNNSTF